MTTSVPAVPPRRAGLKAWAVNQRDKSLGWAREQQTSGTGYRKKAAETLLEHAEMLAQGRSFSRVYRSERRLVVGEDGQSSMRDVEVVQKLPSACFAVMGTTFAIGSYFAVIGYGFALLGGAVFAGIAAGARLAKRDDIACTAKRMSTLTAMAAIPVAGNAFPTLILASELASFARKKS